MKLEHSKNRAEGRLIVGSQKWLKKEAAEMEEENAGITKKPPTKPSPRRPNEKRTRLTKEEAEQEKQQNGEQNEELSIGQQHVVRW